MKKKGQFLLMSIAVLIISMYSIFQYIYTSSETSNVLFQPSFSEEAFNLFRAMDNRNEWIEAEWYNFSQYQARRKIINPDNETHMFNVSLNCSDVVVINSSSNSKLEAIETPYGVTNCTINISNATEGDFIYYSFEKGVEFSEFINMTVGSESSPWYYYAGNRRSKLCSHVREIYSEKQILVECTIY
ncbi:MAG: hypothetical protein JSW73_04660 [Candidatus Woesearchaeota archaeon]|nr:MAG: hypothetical protein JSW73_04660 [Candidatus Woesearchaeota archaeon]